MALNVSWEVFHEPKVKQIDLIRFILVQQAIGQVEQSISDGNRHKPCTVVILTVYQVFKYLLLRPIAQLYRLRELMQQIPLSHPLSVEHDPQPVSFKQAFQCWLTCL